jgi:hypothetical protein
MKAIPKTDAEITGLLDTLVGRENYVFDAEANLWVAPDGYWSDAVLPEVVLQ